MIAEGIFLFTIFACRPERPGCMRQGAPDPTGVALVLQSDPISHDACEAKFHEFVRRMDARPQWHGFFYVRCARADTDV